MSTGREDNERDGAGAFADFFENLEDPGDV